MEVFLKKHFWVVHLGVAALIGFFLARATSHLVAASILPAKVGPRMPAAHSLAPPPPPPSKEEKGILERNIFCSTCPPIIKSPVDQSAQSSGPVKTSLPVRLVVTAVSPDPRWSIAVLCETVNHECGAFGLGLKVKDATVIGIGERRVEFDVQGRLEYLEFEGTAVAAAPTTVSAVNTPTTDDDPLAKDLDKGVRKTSEGNYRLSRDLLEKVLGDTSTLARSARIVPYIVDGKPSGFKLYAIREGSVYSRIGLQNGDAIHAINGYDMSSPDKALEVYTKLRRASHLSVSITRNGQSQTLDYTIQ